MSVDGFGVDPTVLLSRLTAAEENTLGRLRAVFPDRSFVESEHVGAEVVDERGRSYDFIGDPRASLYWHPGQFAASISDHLLKSNDYTVIDMTGFTDSQKDQVRGFLDGLEREARARINRIGL